MVYRPEEWQAGGGDFMEANVAPKSLAAAQFRRYFGAGQRLRGVVYLEKR